MHTQLSFVKGRQRQIYSMVKNYAPAESLCIGPAITMALELQFFVKRVKEQALLYYQLILNILCVT